MPADVTDADSVEAAVDEARTLGPVRVLVNCAGTGTPGRVLGKRGPLLADEARSAGVVYSLAYGDQPALTAELVDWARAAGFRVVAAGKGTKYLRLYHSVTPDDVWSHYGLTPDEAKRAGMNPQMFNSFLDGTKSAIEMVAIANATGSQC